MRGEDTVTLSKKSGIRRATLAGYLKGKPEKDLHRRQRLAEVLGIPEKDLFVEISPAPPAESVEASINKFLAPFTRGHRYEAPLLHHRTAAAA